MFEIKESIRGREGFVVSRKIFFFCGISYFRFFIWSLKGKTGILHRFEVVCFVSTLLFSTWIN